MSTDVTPAPADRPAEITTDLRFALVPEWVLDLGLDAVAVVVYSRLALYADYSTGKCWPSRSTIAGDVGVSTKTVDRAVAALVKAGAIERHRRRNDAGDPTSNLYVVRRAGPGGDTRVATQGHPSPEGGDTGVPTPATPESLKRDLPTETETNENPARTPAQERSATAREVVGAWWEGQDPRPLVPFMRVVKFVERALAGGYDADEVGAAFRSIPTGTAWAEWRMEQSLAGARTAARPRRSVDPGRLS